MKDKLTMALALLVALATGGCRTGKGHATMDHGSYDAALARTTPQATAPAAVTAGIERFSAYYENWTSEAVREQTRRVYAPDAYFRDPYHEVEGLDAIESYFLRSLEPVASCRFIIDGVTAQDGEYFVRWRMELVLKRAKKDEPPIRQVGATHIRLDEQGRVSFHQDYWDSSVVFERLPVVGGMVRWIKSRI